MASTTGKQQSVRGRLPAARRDRRPALAALAVLLILLGALGSALIAFRSGEKVSVLVASDQIPLGKQVEASDFKSIRVSSNIDTTCAGNASDCTFVPSSALRNFVGKNAAYATATIPANTVVSRAMFVDKRPIPSDGELVGIDLDSNQRPSVLPRPGDIVSVHCVKGSGGDSTVACNAQQSVEAARVVYVGNGGTSDVRSVTVLVPKANNQAGIIANLASSGNLAITLLSPDTKPEVDVSTGQGQ